MKVEPANSCGTNKPEDCEQGKATNSESLPVSEGVGKWYNVTDRVRWPSLSCANFVKSLIFPKLNKQSLFLFGSKTAFDKEYARQERVGYWVIHPLSSLRYYYVMIMISLTFVNLITVPVEIAFTLESEITEECCSFAESCNLFSEVLFLLDILLNFRMGFLSEDETVVLDLKIIRMTYLKTWFFADLILSFPIDVAYHIAKNKSHDLTPLVAGKILRILMFLRVLSMIRLLRVSRLMRFFSELEKVSSANFDVVHAVMRIFHLLVLMFILCHWNGCIQYFVPLISNFPEDSWVRKENLMNATMEEKYSFCVFRALSHMIGISYGSIEPPSGEVELWVVMTSMVSGALLYTIMVANASSMMMNFDSPAKAYKGKVSQLTEYMSSRGLPKALRVRIFDYYHSRYRGKWFNEQDVLSLLSKSLREEIVHAMCANILKNSPMFHNRDCNFINAILLRLQFEHFQPGDVIVYKESLGDRMFFIEHGQVLVKSNDYQKELIDGDYFGEICLLTICRRQADVKALTPCQLFSLSRQSFQEVLRGFPDVLREFEDIALQHQAALKSQSNGS